MTDAWQPGKTYPPGSLARPRATPPVVTPSITNADFETGDWTGWAQVPSWNMSQNAHYSGSWSLQLDAYAGGAVQDVVSTNKVPVNVGQVINAQVMVQQGAASSGQAGAVIKMVWYDAAGNELSRSQGTDVHSGSGGHWKSSAGRFVAPAGAAQAAVAIGGWNNSNDLLWVDLVTWDYAYAGPPAGLVYKAVQPAPGKSGSTEPAWPPVLGQTVVDNEVIWEAVIATRLVWEAIPLLKSGDAEPVWPDDVGAQVRDNTIDWEVVSRRITDVNCPHSKIVAIAAGKVYAADNDIIRYCATVNPLDWTSADDAGYLPFGLQTYGSNPVAAMGLYRSNLVPFNAEGFQMWQVDTDPANTSLLDALPVATTYNKALAPVANDLLFLSSQGVRSIGIAASSTNLQAGDVGMPIDVLVKAAMGDTVDEPRATFLPALGQYWLAINAGDRTSCTVFVYTLNQIGQVGKWSRYLFPFPIDDFMIMDEDLYLRSGDDVLCYDDAVAVDFAGDSERERAFPGAVQYQWLDFGKPGVPKQVVGFDLVGSGNPTFALGYDQSNEGTFTTDFAVPADTVPGQIIPLPVMAPSMSVRVSYPGGQKWQLQAVSLYLQDMRTGS